MIHSNTLLAKLKENILDAMGNQQIISMCSNDKKTNGDK